MTAAFKCGHERSPDNIKIVRSTGTACLKCFRELDRNYRRRVRGEVRAIAKLHEAARLAAEREQS